MPFDQSLQKSDYPQRLAWISTWDVRCGIAEYSRFLLEHWPRQEQPIVLFNDTRADKSEIRLGSNAVISHPCWIPGDDASLTSLFKALEEYRPDHLVVQHQPGLITWRGLGKLLEFTKSRAIPCTVVLHNVQNLAIQSDVNELTKPLVAIRHLLVHTNADKKILADIGIRGNVAVFPHGAIANAVTTVPARSITKDTKEVLIGAYGFMLPHKGFLELVKAVGKLSAEWQNIRLRMVTSQYPIPESEAYLKQCRDANSLPDKQVEWHTDYLPNQQSLDLLRDCDLIIMPYLETTESASGALRNALASRAPVMVSPIAFFDEAGPAVLRANGRCADALAISIRDALMDLSLRKRVKSNARRWLRARDWAKMSLKLHGMIAG